MSAKRQRQSRLSQAKHRGAMRSYKTELENTQLILAWEATELSEGQISAILNIDRVTLRMMREGAIAAGMKIAESLSPAPPKPRAKRQQPKGGPADKIAAALADGVQLSRQQVMEAAGITRNQFKRHATKVACTALRSGSKGALWVLKEFSTGMPTATTRIEARLEELGKAGALVLELVDAVNVSNAQVRVCLDRGLTAGVFGWHTDPGPINPTRKRWYLAKYRPENAPEPAPKTPKSKKAKAAATPKKPAKAKKPVLRAVWAPGVEVVCNVQVTECKSNLAGRFAVDKPGRHIDPNECSPWARAAAGT